MDPLFQIEMNIIVFIQSLGTWLAAPMRLVSLLGTENFFILVIPSFYWCLEPALGLRIAIILLLNNWTNMFFKLIFHLPRPYWLSANVKGYSAESSFGIPSGHAQFSAGIWGMVAVSSRQTWARTALILLIFLVGFSRVFLGVHFISDVLAGWLLGGLILFVFLKVERPLVEWLKARSLAQLLVLALVTSLLICATSLFAALPLSEWQIPAEWTQNALASQPGTPLDPLNLDNAFTISGIWLGFLAGFAWLYHRQGGFDASGTPAQRLARYGIGLIGILILWYGLGKVFPRDADAISYGLRYIRYAVIGGWISAVCPLLFKRMGLIANTEKQISSLSPGENTL